MIFDHPKQVVAIALFIGIIAYLASALWCANFLVILPQAEDAIVDYVEIQTIDSHGDQQIKYHPIQFKNTLEELKYYHNERMVKKHRHFNIAELIAGGLLGACVFFSIAKLRNNIDSHSKSLEIAGGGALIGFFAVLIISSLLSIILPAPAKWFPHTIAEIREKHENETLKQLKVSAEELDAYRKETIQLFPPNN